MTRLCARPGWPDPGSSSSQNAAETTTRLAGCSVTKLCLILCDPILPTLAC